MASKTFGQQLSQPLCPRNAPSQLQGFRRVFFKKPRSCRDPLRSCCIPFAVLSLSPLAPLRTPRLRLWESSARSALPSSTAGMTARARAREKRYCDSETGAKPNRVRSGGMNTAAAVTTNDAATVSYTHLTLPTKVLV